MTSGNTDAAEMLRAMRAVLKENDMMAYLAMMAVRLLELHRVLKPMGSLYLHCDPTASHYLKILLDGIFDKRHFVNEISWRRTTAKADYVQGAKHFPHVRDIIFFYRKTDDKFAPFHQTFAPYDGEYVSTKYTHTDTDGRLYRLDNLTGPGGAAKGNPSYEVMGVTRFW
jgi:adenine specific DNA methylase Mod